MIKWTRGNHSRAACLCAALLACSLALSGVARAATYYVNDLNYSEDGSVCTAAGDDGKDGRSPSTPKRHIQALLKAYPSIGSGDVLRVDPGTYYENVSVGSGHNGLKIQGAGSARSIVDGDGKSSVFKLSDFDNGVLAGLTIRNGSADEGGGIYCNGSSSTITCNRITGNEGGMNGGGFIVKGGSPTITNNVITFNTAYFGGGLYLQNCSPTFANNTIVDNDAESCGGAFYGNDCHFTMANCILWANESHSGFPNGEIMLRSDAELWIRYCDIMDGDGEIYAWMGGEYHWGPGNMDKNPKFVGAAAARGSVLWDVRRQFVRAWDQKNYRLSAGSPCIDAADGNYAPGVDMVGTERCDDPDTPNKGTGNPPYADMGAYEFWVATVEFAFEHGTKQISDEWATISFSNTYVNPVVVAGPATFNGVDPGVVRVRNVTPTSCQIRFQEWDYLDGVHTTEAVHYIVVEQGSWQIGTGKLLIAGRLPTSNADAGSPTVVNFPKDFSATPVVIATQQTANGDDVATERVRNVQPTRFSVALQEQEAGDKIHCQETIGYVAVGQGYSGSSADPQDVTYWWGSPVGWDVFIQEEQSADAETDHCPETIGYLAFGTIPGETPHFLADMQTANGGDPCDLRCQPLARTFRMEDGTVSITTDWQTVNLTKTYEYPVVLAGPATYDDPGPGVVRVRQVTSDSFQVRFEEWPYLDGSHAAETIHYMVVERGAWQIGSGTLLIADRLATANTNAANPSPAYFPLTFNQAPVVVATQQSASGSDAVTERISAIQTRRFSVVLQEEEAGGAHGLETIGYVAIGPGTGGLSAGPQDVTASTWCPAGWDTQVVEEQSADGETLHCVETVGYFAFSGSPDDDPPFVASMQTCLGADPASLRCDRLAETFQMEHGTASINQQWQTINLVNTYEHPVVIAGPATYYGLDPGVVRLRNVTSSSFDIRFQEWNYMDDYHIQEGVHYLVVERGSWQIGASTLLVADAFGTSNTNTSSPTAVPFPLSFTSAPVVVATQQTAKGGDAVTERISNVQAARFSIALQEEEAGGAHVGETVGYIAIGTGTGGVAAGAVDITVGTGAPSGWQILVVEEKSKDSETSHCWEKVGYFALTGTPPGLPPMVASMQTCYGTDTASLRCRPLVTRAPRLVRLALSGVQALASLARYTAGQARPSAGVCELTVLAQDASGKGLEGVAIAVSAGDRAWVEATPALLTCQAGEPVTLTAPDSILCGGEVLSFSHWSLDGRPLTPGLTECPVDPARSRQAAAIYAFP